MESCLYGIVLQSNSRNLENSRPLVITHQKKKKITMIALSGKDASYDDTLHGTGSNLGKQLCCILKQFLRYLSPLMIEDIVFDLLYVNARSVMDLSLQQRMLLLKRCLKTQTKVLEVVEQKEAKTTADVIEALDSAIMNR